MLATAKMSTKGQIVIPENIRESLGLIPGTEFIVIKEGDHIILKLIKKPPKQQLKELLNKAHAKAEAMGITNKEIMKAIKDSRLARKKK
jgi:AbrB family looped-hinge helix DNA binding protein